MSALQFIGSLARSATHPRCWLVLLSLGTLLAGCGQPEAKVDRTLAGTWVVRWVAPDGADVETKNTFKADGRWICHTTYTLSNQVTSEEFQGAVEIKDGFLIQMLTNRFEPGGPPLPSSCRSLIVRTNDDELVLKQADTETEFIYRRQK